MKKIFKVLLSALFFVGAISTAQAEVFKAPAGSTITAKAGNGTVEVSWTGLSVDKVVRFWLVKSDPNNGSWTSAQTPPAKSATLVNVCESNDKYPADARFQLKTGSKWLLITPTEGVPNATLYGVKQECTRSTKGCALEVDESILQSACAGVAK
jgi:hypothetical protein